MKPTALQVQEVLSQVVTCDANCASCRAAAQALLDTGVLALRECPLCLRAYAPDLGPCPCASHADGNAAAAAFHGEKREPANAVQLDEYRDLRVKAFRPLLAVLNPRAIPECIASFEAARIDKVWLRGYTERQLVPVFEQLLQDVSELGYTHLLACSDDVVINDTALEAVLDLLRAGEQVATGFCRLDAGDERVNLTWRPLRGPHPTLEAYSFCTRADVAAWPEPQGRTWFAGMCLTGMPLALWERYPFDCFGEPGYGSDFSLSIRLQMDGVAIAAARDGLVRHVKETWNHRDTAPEKRLLVGEIPARVVFDPHVAPAVSEESITLDRYRK